jgi:hypothetical protein
VLREKKKRLSVKAGAEATNVVSVKQGTPSTAMNEWLVASR